jgi:hypothetical protein
MMRAAKKSGTPGDFPKNEKLRYARLTPTGINVPFSPFYRIHDNIIVNIHDNNMNTISLSSLS